MPEALRNAIVSGALVYGLAVVGPVRRGAALLLLAVAFGVGLGLRYLVPADLLHLGAWSGLGPETLLLPLWAVYGAFARRAPRPWLPGPAWVVAPLLGALLGEVPAAALLSAGAPDVKTAGRLALAAAAGGMLGRLGDPAVLVLADRVPHLSLLMLPVAAACLVLARVKRADLPSAETGSRMVTAMVVATAVAAAVPGLTLPALGLGTLALGIAGMRLPERGRGGVAEIAWTVASVGLVLFSVAGGLADFLAQTMEQVSEFLGRLPLPAMTAASGLIAAMIDAPATSLLTAATLDRCPSLVEPGLGLAFGMGAVVGGTGPLIAAGALGVGWKRWLLALALACAWMAALSPWFAPP